MLAQELIDIIITALDERGELKACHRYMGSKAVQVKLKSGQYFNIKPVEVKKGESYIMARNRKNPTKADLIPKREDKN